MSSIKCSNCGLVNFVTAQFCKRCNLSLTQTNTNNTQVFNQGYNTNVRQPLPNPPQNNYQPLQKTIANQQNQGYDYTLPRFPKDERPQNFNQQQYQPNYQSPPPQIYQQPVQYQQPIQYAYQEPPFRRFGSEFAVHKNVSLPCACVKCGMPVSISRDGDYVSQKYRWHSPYVYIALISPIIYLILALALSQSFSANIPLCNEHLKNRNSVLNFLFAGSLAAFVLIVLFGWIGASGLALLVFFIAIIGLPMAHEYGYKPLRVSKIEGNYYHFKGASEEFLRNVPY